MSRIRTTLACSAALAVPLATLTVPSALAVTAAPRVVTTSSAYGGYSSGSIVYANAVNLGNNGSTVAKAEVANSTAAVAENGATLTTTDTLGQPQLLSTSAAGGTAYGHGSGVNVGLLTSTAATPQIRLSTAERLSPPPGSGVPSADEVLSLPLSPIASVHVLPSHAQSNTTTDHQCPTVGTPLSEGDAHAANADVVQAGTTTVAQLAATSDSTTTTTLAGPTAADGTALAGAGKALVTETTETIAPIKILAGTPAEIDITVLKPLVLTAAAGGVNGSAHITYGFAGVTPTTPVLSITIAGNTQTLTSQQFLGSDGLKIGVGVADITIGTPAHALGGNETTTPAVAANGTSASASSDLVRVTSPGTLPLGVSSNGPLAAVTSALNPLVSALGTLLTPIQTALAASLGIADVRVGHIDATSSVPVGGVICNTPSTPDTTNPFSENYKDVSSITVVPGQQFDYTVRFPNRGTTPVTNVKVVDTYSSSLDFVGSKPSPTSHSGNVLTYNIGTLQPNQFAQITLHFKAPANAPSGTTYKNTAVISGTYAGRPVGGTVTVSGPTVHPPVSGDCVLKYSSMYSSNKVVVPGENFTDYVDALDSGTKDCTDVTVVEPLPKGTTFVSCSPSCTVKDGTVTFSIGTIHPGQSKTVAVTLKTTATSGRLPGKATVSSPDGPSAGVSTNDPVVGTASVGSPGKAAGCRSSCPTVVTKPGKQLAYTGSSPWLPYLGLGFAAAGALLMRRRRSIS